MLGEMFSLEEQFPEVYHKCIPGNFSAELSDGVFSRVETDKVIEMTINKDTKTLFDTVSAILCKTLKSYDQFGKLCSVR